jgi:hypothetical protein
MIIARTKGINEKLTLSNKYFSKLIDKKYELTLEYLSVLCKLPTELSPNKILEFSYPLEYLSRLSELSMDVFCWLISILAK